MGVLLSIYILQCGLLWELSLFLGMDCKKSYIRQIGHYLHIRNIHATSKIIKEIQDNIHHYGKI
jgi:hypothetical protein